MKKKKEQKYRLTVTEHQLRLIAACLEDLHRFMGGQMELFNTAACLEDYCELRDKLKELQPLVTPHLPSNSSYGWNGGSCDNVNQRKFLAETYCIYREILHRLTVDHGIDNVYASSTPTCKEGGELPIIEKL